MELDVNGIIARVDSLGEDNSHNQIIVPVELRVRYNTAHTGNSYDWASDVDYFTLTKVL